ncbi:MAG TPA: NHL repeat-containing protein, partial [Vicinamibacteria bacterium]
MRAWLTGLGAGLCMLLALGAAPAQAAFDDPLYVAAPAPPPSLPPPNGYLNGPCGLAVDSAGQIYLADHHHDAVDVFTPAFTYVSQLAGVDGPCGLALDSSGDLYVNRHHRDVTGFSPFPDFTPGSVLDAGPSTGVAVDPATDHVYVNERDHVSVYDSAGSPVLVGGNPLRIGTKSLGEGYGLAVSGFGGTAGRVYVADAADGTVKVYDPATDAAIPVETIAGPPEGFTSLRDSSVAVDRVSGDVYVVDDLQPGHAEQPRAIVQVFSAAGAYEGHLKHWVVHGSPTGLAVDNSGGSTQGRVYVTSGNTHFGGLFAYPPNAATKGAPLPSLIHLQPLGGDDLFPTTPIGAPAAPPSGVDCEGDNCQSLPAEPVDPTLTTLLHGLGNPRVRYRRVANRCRRPARAPRRAKRCGPKRPRRGARSSRVGASPTGQAPTTATAAAAPSAAPGPTRPAERTAGTAGSAAFTPVPAGFAAGAWDQRGEPASLAGSHPSEVELTFGFDQGPEDLRGLEIDLPPGLLLNPATVGPCSAAAFVTPRSSPYGPSASGESCPDRSQVGTVELESGFGGGQTRRFGLFSIGPPNGSAIRLGASPFGLPFVLDARIGSSEDGAHTFALGTPEVPQALEVAGLRLSLWGVPWDASHNGERGNCLNESEPLFPWAKCSVGEPLDNRPLAFLTLPTACGRTLTFGAQADFWQGGPGLRAEDEIRDESGDPVRVSDCMALGFVPHAEGLLSTSTVSSPTGFTFRLTNEDQRLGDPRARIASLPRRAVVELPDGVTLNPSLGAGLEVCTPTQYAAESATSPHGAGCPNGARIGDFLVRTPFYQGFLR